MLCLLLCRVRADTAIGCGGMELGGWQGRAKGRDSNGTFSMVKTVLDPTLVGIGEFTTHFRLPILVLGLGCL